MDWNYLSKLMSILLSGLQVSLKIFILTLLFSIPLGIIVACLSMSKNKMGRARWVQV